MKIRITVILLTSIVIHLIYVGLWRLLITSYADAWIAGKNVIPFHTSIPKHHKARLYTRRNTNVLESAHPQGGRAHDDLASMQHTNTLPIFPTQAVASRPDLRRLRDKSPYSFFLRRGSPASEQGCRAPSPLLRVGAPQQQPV